MQESGLPLGIHDEGIEGLIGRAGEMGKGEETLPVPPARAAGKSPVAKPAPAAGLEDEMRAGGVLFSSGGRRLDCRQGWFFGSCVGPFLPGATYFGISTGQRTGDQQEGDQEAG